MTRERKLKRLILARFERQKAALLADLERNGYKAITAPGAYIPDDPAEVAALIELIFDGVQDGAKLFEEQTGVSISDILTNQRALDYAKKYVTEWLAGLDATTQDAIRKAIAAFIETPGFTLADASRVLESYFGSDRAFRIAVTEITRAYAQGNQIAGEILQAEYPGMIVYKRWFTNRDDRVCPICGQLDGDKTGINGTWEANGKEYDNPPAHPNCRCWTGVTIDPS